MRHLLLPFTPRYIVLTLAIAGTAFAALSGATHKLSVHLAFPLVLFGFFSLVGMRDLIQTKHAILRNYPIAAHIRFILEHIRPELRQYFFENEKDGMPFPRDKRAIVYQRAKKALDTRPFGTHYDVYQNQYEWLHHSIVPREPSGELFRIMIGGSDCTQPYCASVFNISALSFGSLSANAIRALNKGAKLGGFAHDTGEGGVSPYHLEHGGDLIWEIGSGYFCCRNHDGSFSPEKFAALAIRPEIKMIELKLSQGAKPGHGGVLPAAKVTREISRIRDVPMGQDCISPARHSAFSTPIEMMQFIAELRAPLGRQADRLQALRRPPLGVPRRGQGDAQDRASRPTSSSSTAPRAAPAPRRWSSWTMWACRCATGSPSCTPRWSAPICATGSSSAPPARSPRPSTWRG